MTDDQRPLPPRPNAVTAIAPPSSVGSPPASAPASDVQGTTNPPFGGVQVDFGASSATPPPSKIDPYLGRTIDGRYIVDSVLGEGGMGIVYRGRHKVIDKKVAIKVLRGEMARDAEVTERFLQEARAASAIGNPHIIDISDFGQLPDGSTYFVMEYLEGKSLGAVLEESRPLPVPRLCHVAKQIAEALAAAHAANIIHRDLKPDNIMMVNRGTQKDFVKILDFGIAKVGSAGSKMTKAGSVFGTPHYMSPEQAAGAVVDLRTDIYALGVILYEMASGKVPFDADNFMGILTQHMYKSPVPIRALVPAVDVPPGLDAIILKSLTKKPEGRYATMNELILDLEKLEKGLLPDAVQEMMARSGGFNVPADYFRSAMPAPVPASPMSIPHRSRLPLYAAIGVVATVIGVAAIVLVAKSGPGNAQTNVPSASQIAPPPPTSAATASPTKPVVMKSTALVATPLNATIKRGDQTLKNPAAIEVPEGTTVDLVVSLAGYTEQTITLTAGESKSITMQKTAAPLPTGKLPTGVKPPTTPTAPQPPPTGKPPAPKCDPDDPFCKH